MQCPWGKLFPGRRAQPAASKNSRPNYKFFAEQKKAQQIRIEQERRAGVVHQLFNEANKQGEKSNVEGTPAKETAPAK
jgi:hypothetical protein